MKRIIFALAAAAILATTAAAQLPFIGLSAEESAAIAREGAVTRASKNAKALALPSAAPGATTIAADLKKLGPNYVVEVLGRFPADGADVPANLARSLSDPVSWIGIPYWSESYGRFYDLFDKCVVLSKVARAGGGEFEALHHMKPFEDYSARYSYAATGSSVTFSGTNTSPLVYKGFKAVGVGDMDWRLAAWRDGAWWYFYGVGAVKAFDMFGAVRDRLEPSFIGRTEAFFEFMRGRVAGKR